jgi:hypothetical protein
MEILKFSISDVYITSLRHYGADDGLAEVRAVSDPVPLKIEEKKISTFILAK